MLAMFERFRPFRLEGIREDTMVTTKDETCVLDFIIAMNLLARIVYEKSSSYFFFFSTTTVTAV